MRVNGRWWRVVSLGLSLGVGWGSLSQAQPNARIPDSTTPPLLAQATPAPTTLPEQIRELEAQIEAARQRGGSGRGGAGYGPNFGLSSRKARPSLTCNRSP